MTTLAITCEIFSDQLMNFLENDLDDATRVAMEAHAQGCAACGALLADLRGIAARAGALPTLAPSRDLWLQVAQQIATPIVPMAPRTSVWPRRIVITSALAATFAFAAVLGYATTHRTPASAETTAATRAPSSQTAAARLVSATPEAVEHSYDTEIVRLRAIVNARQAELDPVTLAVIQKNLKVIDDAIAQCKAALAHDPASGFLIQSLNESLDTKVQLLRTAAMLPARAT